MAGPPPNRQTRGFPTTRATGDGRRRGVGIAFIGETVSELKKVTWPTRPETTRLTILVITIASIVGAALGLIDVGFSRLMGFILGN